MAALARFGSAIKDFRSGSETTHKQAATACFQVANRLSQRACVLRQAKSRKEQAFESVEQAVAAAIRMKTEEGFDLFRGQRCAWPVVSSFRRLDAETQSDAHARVNRFINWAKGEAALTQYGFSSDQAIAIAQHYGIPTTFLDFSTDIEVARYFATEHCLRAPNGNAAEPLALSCIVAVRSADLEAWVKARFRPTGTFLGPQLLRVDVPNLWRLEAQAGLFLVDGEILDDYPFRYLLFPASVGPEPALDRSTVYPKEKSDLELVLEQWFWHEQASAGTRSLLAKLDENGVPYDDLSLGPTDGIGLKAVLRPGPHPSWSGREMIWVRPTERFDEIRPGSSDSFQIDLRPGMSLDAVRSLVETLLPLDTLAARRRRSADWRVLVDDCANPETAEKLARQWDALRIDGYSDAQVVASFAASISLMALQLGLLSGWPSYDGSLGVSDDIKPLTAVLGGDLLVEFNGLVGYSRAVVSAADLNAAVREDIDRFVPASVYEHCGPTPAERMHQLLIGIHRPTLLFDFDRFANVYVRQVVPMSAVFRPKLPLYPVLHLQTFGVP